MARRPPPRLPARPRPRARRGLGAIAVAVTLATTSCSGGTKPELVASAPTATELPVPTSTSEPTPTPRPSPTPVPTPTVEPRTRGIDETTIRIGIVTTRRSYADVDVGVRARLERAVRDGGVAGRRVEIAEVIDDAGDPDATLAAVRRLVEEVGVFAVVLASAVPEPAVTDYLEANQTPYFGWGFAPGFCAPNRWGFGFSGCLTGAVSGVAGATVDPSARLVLEAQLGPDPAVALVVAAGPAAVAAEAVATELWGENLMQVVRLPESEDADSDDSGAVDQVLAAVESSPRPVDAILLSVGLERVVALKPDLMARFEGMVVDDVSYFPGLLGDIPTALRLEAGYAITRLPPQEEYREVTGVVANDLEEIGGPLVYSQAITIGYWSADLLVALLEAVGPDLDLRSFSETVHDEGVRYDPAFAGGPCPISTSDIQRRSAGGAALLQVRGGIYRPVVEFLCPAETSP